MSIRAAARDRLLRALPRIACAAALLAGPGCAPPPAMDMPGSDGGPVVAGKCAAQVYFEEHAWPEVFSVCATCHVPGGASGGTRFVLRPAAAPGAVTLNFGVASTAARN